MSGRTSLIALNTGRTKLLKDSLQSWSERFDTLPSFGTKLLFTRIFTRTHFDLTISIALIIKYGSDKSPAKHIAWLLETLFNLSTAKFNFYWLHETMQT